MMFDIGKRKAKAQENKAEALSTPPVEKYVPPPRKPTEPMERPKISNTGFDHIMNKNINKSKEERDKFIETQGSDKFKDIQNSRASKK